MNFLRNRTLAFQLSFVLATLAVLFVAEFLVIRWNFRSLEKMHYQRDLARKTQLLGQQVFFDAVAGTQDPSTLSRTITSKLEEQDYALRILSDGGRIAGTSMFVGKLQDLPKISFEELKERWLVFKQTAERIAAASNNLNVQKEVTMARSQWTAIDSWYNRLIDDLDLLIADKRFGANAWMVAVAIFNIAASVCWYPVFRRKILDPLKALENNTAVHKHTLNLERNEIGAAALQVNNVIEQLKDASDFVKAIGEGKLTLNYEEFDKGYTRGSSRLADSLIDMQSRLRQLSEEDQRRQWINEGLTKFVDILRSGADNLKTLGDHIISTLANYTGSNQGGLYLLNDSDEKNPHLEMISLFAFDVKKHETRQIKIGEGLLGQAFLEKQTSYLKHLPPEYVRITSGLGGAHPSTLLIVPMKIDQDVFGVIELASFNDYPEHVITFVERLGETIASTFATVKAAQQNRELLAEARHATEAMRSQEEEMRQNMEELQATQEEMARKERDYISRIEVLEKAVVEQSAPAENGRTPG
ncbi:MAG TPA: GAF domain-containing protein [Cyclobacteriaceae bacterium]|nr:GAF domain-containing protein [Cyclobacteriaceae bacterium]